MAGRHVRPALPWSDGQMLFKTLLLILEVALLLYIWCWILAVYVYGVGWLWRLCIQYWRDVKKDEKCNKTPKS